MPDILSKTFDVAADGDTYTFRIPTIRFDIEVSYKAADVRRRAFPDGQGVISDADNLAYNFSRGAAYLELYLEKATATWPFSTGKDGKPVVDFESFPPHLGDKVFAVGAAFNEAYGRFRRTGNFNIPASGAETMAGQPDPGTP